MRRRLALLLSAALTAAALPPAAYAQAAVRLASPRTAVPGVAVPGGTLGPLAAPLNAPSPAPSFIMPSAALPAPTLPTPRAGPAAPAAVARPLPAQAALHAAPSVASALAPAARRAPLSPEPSVVPELRFAANDNEPGSVAEAARREAKARVVVRFAELRAAFDERAPQDIPVAAANLAPAPTPAPVLAPNRAEPPSSAKAEPPAPAERKAGRGFLGFAPALAFFLAALAVQSVGIEASNLGMPPLIAKVFGDVTLSAEMGMWSSVADIVGSVVTPAIIKRLGLKKTFLVSAGARMALAALTAGLLAAGVMTVPWLMALTALGAAVGGVNYTAEKAIPAVLLEQDRAGLERFKAARQGVIEVVATLIPIAAGALVAQFGFLPAVFAFPVAGVVAMALVAVTLRMPQRAAAAMAARLPEGAPLGMKGFLSSMTRGTRLLWGVPTLRASFLAYAAFSLLTFLLYWIIAPAYGILVAGPGQEEAAALVQGLILGLFSLGGLAASVFVVREHKRFARLPAPEKEAAMRTSLRRWMILASLSLGVGATMAFPLPAWGALTVPALALIPAGMAQVVAKLKLEALFQSAAPPDALDDVTAALEAWMSVGIMAGLWGVKGAFAAAAGYGAFAIIAWAMLPLGLAGLLLTRVLAGRKKTV